MKSLAEDTGYHLESFKTALSEQSQSQKAMPVGFIATKSVRANPQTQTTGLGCQGLRVLRTMNGRWMYVGFFGVVKCFKIK